MLAIDYNRDDVQYIDVDFHNLTQTSTVYAKQYDSKTRFIIATVWKDGMPYDLTDEWSITFRATKPDKKGILNPCFIVDGKIGYEMTLQTTTVDGMFDCEFVMTAGEGDDIKILSCPKFKMRVEKAALEEDTVISTDEFSILTDLIEEARKVISDGGALSKVMQDLIDEGSALFDSLESSEANRVAAENERDTNENQRILNEEERQQSEQIRDDAEAQRVIAEAERVANELQRIINENARIAAETARDTAEQQRATSESSREVAETTREIKETERQENELERISNEEERIAAELLRPDYIYLTQAEYDALPEEDKLDRNKIYEITDDDGLFPSEIEALITSTNQAKEDAIVATQEALDAAERANNAANDGLPNVGTAGTYTKVTTDSKGRVVNGATPTKIADLGITDVYTKTEIDTKTNDVNTSLANQIGTASGASINLPNSFNGGLLLKELQGKSIQNGTPTPENKVDIISVGDNGSVVVKVARKNLFPRTAKTATTINGITFTPNSDGSITVNGTAIASVDFYFIDSLPYPVGNYIFSGNGLASGKVEMSVVEYTSTGVYVRHSRFYSTLKNDLSKLSPTNVIRVSLFVAKDSIIQNVTVYPQLELGTTSTAYEPYKEQLITIPLTQPLRSVGSVYDRGCVKVNGVWGNERKIGYAVFDGSADESISIDTLYPSPNTDLIRFNITGTNVKALSTVICNKFKYVLFNLPVMTEECISSHPSSPTIVIFIKKSRLSTLDATGFRTWLSLNPISVTYEWTTHTFEPFSQSIQDQLNALQTYQGVTNVFTTDTQQPVIVVNYGKSDTSALSIYANNIQDSKANKVDIPTKLPADGGNADTLDDKHLSDLYSLRNLPKIPVNTDLNNWRTIGQYAVGDNDSALTVLNKPHEAAFTLLVEDPTGHDGSSYLLQTFKSFDGFRTYTRLWSIWNNGGNWGGWVSVLRGTNTANNLTTNVEGFVLDARQGKVLNDKIDKIGTIQVANPIATTIPANTLTRVTESMTIQAGTYMIIGKTGFGFDIERDVVFVNSQGSFFMQRNSNSIMHVTTFYAETPISMHIQTQVNGLSTSADSNLTSLTAIRLR